MVRVITLLSLWQLKNAIRSTLTDYRKLIPLVVIVFFIATQFLSTMLIAGSRPPNLPEVARQAVTEQIEVIRIAAFLVLSLISIGIIDYGFSQGFLTFSLADVDYLFPSPIPRRLILAYRLGAKTLTSFFQAAMLFYFLVWRLVESVSPGQATFHAGVVAFGGLLCCLGGYASLAFALKMIFGFGRLATVRRWVLGLFGVSILLLGYTYWQFGMAGLSSITRNALVVALFYPCRLAAETLTGPLVGHTAWAALAQLGLFYAGATALLFSRNENFYEASLESSERAARMIQAARDQNWSAMFTIQAEGKRKSGRERPYAIPPFGSGGMALFWANLAAAAKRPVANLWAPLLGGTALALIATLALPTEASAFVVAGLTVYLLFLMTMSGMALYRQSVARQPLIRPLPLAGWQVVLADVLPRCFLSSLFAWSGSAVLLFSPADHAHTISALLALCVPAALLALNLVQFMLALWYPDAQDKLQQLLAGFVSLFLTMTVMSLMAVGLIVPLLLRIPGWLTGLIFMVPALTASGILLACASVVYRRFQPKQ